MADLPTISAALSSLKTATEIAKLLKNNDVSPENAELKLNLAELINSLADASIEIVDVQEFLSEKEKKIIELQDAFKNKENLVQERDAYYETDDNGKPHGQPICKHC